jgi:hypothetical protein
MSEMPEVLNEAEAAEYCRLSVNSFRKAVKAGDLPKPPILAVRRRIWHVEALKAALGGGPAVTNGGQDDSDRREAAWRKRRQGRAGRAG